MNALFYVYLSMTLAGFVLNFVPAGEMMSLFIYAGASSISLSPILAFACSEMVPYLGIIWLIIGLAMLIMLIPMLIIVIKRKNHKIFVVYSSIDWLITLIYALWYSIVGWDTMFVWCTILPAMITKTLFWIAIICCYKKVKNNMDVETENIVTN